MRREWGADPSCSTKSELPEHGPRTTLHPRVVGIKRHPALIPLSRDHHNGLVQAVRLRRAAARCNQMHPHLCGSSRGGSRYLADSLRVWREIVLATLTDDVSVAEGFRVQLRVSQSQARAADHAACRSAFGFLATSPPGQRSSRRA